MNSPNLPEASAFKKRWQGEQKARRESGADCAYLYVHLEQDSGEPFYVGMGETVGRPWERDRNLKHRNRANKYGMRVEICADLQLTWENALWWEIRWIKAFRDAGYELTNLTNGGDGVDSASSKIIQNRPERRAANSAAQKIAQNRPEVKAKRSAAVKKALADPEIKEKTLAAQKAAQRTETAIKNRAAANARPEVKAKRSASQNNPETNARRSIKIKQAFANRTPKEQAITFEKQSRAQKIAKNDPEYKRRNSEIQKIVQLEAQNRPEVRAKKSASLILAATKKTPEERSLNTLRGWETRRKNKLKEL